MSPLRRAEGGGIEAHLPKDLKEFGELAQLLFEWPVRQSPRLALPACILFAAILQAGMVILFSISYSTPSEIQPSSPQVYFIPPDSAVAHQLAPWLAANDPAVFSPQADTRDALPSPPPLKYRPSYEEPPPPLRPLPREVVPPVVPPLPPQMADLMRKKRLRVPAESEPPPPAQTVVHWQDDLAARTPLSSSVKPPVPLSASVQPTLYEVGVSPEGVPMHCIQLDSSGDPSSDEAGSVWIHTQKFQQSAQASWGRVLIIWGAPTTKSETLASPSPSPAQP